MSEKVSIYPEKLSLEEKYLIWEWFRKVKKQLIKELEQELKKEKNIDKKLLIKDYINKIKILTPDIIKFSNEDSSVNARTYFNNNIAEKIVIYKKNLSYQNNKWLNILLVHELEHYIWRDKQWKINIDKNTRELNAKLISFRYYLINNWYKLSEEWINKLFRKIEKEIKSNKLSWKNKEIYQNIFSQSEEVELFYIYERFINKKEKLLIYLQKLVNLDKLKKEVYYT